MSELIWEPLLESAGQTIVGAIGSYTFTKILSKMYKKNTFFGPMDLWKRGLIEGGIEEGDKIHIDCLISPYTQLFPGNPYENARKWKEINKFNGKINNKEYSTLEFYCGSDPALRIGSLNGETLVGLYQRFGYIGDGLIAVAPTTLIKKEINNFFLPKYYGSRAIISGEISRCPSQHGIIAQSISIKAGIPFSFNSYKNLWYLKINSIKPFTKNLDNSTSLLGSTWAVSSKKNDSYILEYGYLSDSSERNECISNIMNSKAWENAMVYFDDIDLPDSKLSFKSNYII